MTILAWALLALFALLQVGDWYTTRTVLAQGGRELNPVIRWLMAVLGIDGTLIVKGLFATLMGYVLVGQAWWAIVPVIALYSFIVWRNWRAFRGAAR
jgi:hypothetical protein